MTAQSLSQSRIKVLLHYNPKTGNFIWKIRTSNRINIGDIAGCISSIGYVFISVDSILYKAHRLAYLYMTGNFPENEIDHINKNTGDNRWINLRDVTHQENLRNQKLNKRNKSGCCGVSWNSCTKKWRADIMVNQKNIYLGEREDYLESVAARKAGEIKYGFHENHGKL